MNTLWRLFKNRYSGKAVIRSFGEDAQFFATWFTILYLTHVDIIATFLITGGISIAWLVGRFIGAAIYVGKPSRFARRL